MRRQLWGAMAILLAMTVLGEASARETTNALERAREAFAEKSYAIAARYYDEALQGALPVPAKRQARYERAIVSLRLGQTEEAQRQFALLAENGSEDRWSALAVWQLLLLRAKQGLDQTAATSLPEQLRRAERLVGRSSPTDLAEFYKSVVSEVLPMWYPATEAALDVQLEMLDRAIAHSRAPGDIAELHRRRALLRHEHGRIGEDQFFAELKNIVREFPKTSAAREAQVTIARQLTSREEWSAALAEWRKVIELWPDSAEAAEARRTCEEIEHEFVALQLASLYTPGEPIDVAIAVRNSSRAEVLFSKVDPARLLEEGPTANEMQLDLLAIEGRVIAKRTVEVGKRGDLRGTTTSLHLDPRRAEDRLPAGLYIVQARTATARAAAMMTVSRLVLLACQSGNIVYFWVVDAMNGQPRPNAVIFVRHGWGAGPSHRLPGKPARRAILTKLRCDEHGFAEFEVPDSVGREGVDAVAMDGEECALLLRQYVHFFRSQPQTFAYVYTDRPAYRPGDTVRWRALIRGWRDGRLELAGKGPWQAMAKDPRGTSLYTHSLAANAYGAVSGEFVIPGSSALGLSTLVIADATGREIGSVPFRVEEYRKPEFEITLVTEQRLIPLGGRVDVTGQARYLFGAPVAHATVQFHVTARPRWWVAFSQPWSETLAWFPAEQRTIRPHAGSSSGEIVAQGTATTDGEGKFRFSFLAIPPKNDVLDCPPYEFTITAAVTDSARRQVEHSTDLCVGRRALQVTVTPERHIYAPRDRAKIVGRTQNLTGDPVASTATLAIEKVVWDEATQQEMATTLSLVEVQTGPDGRLAYEWRIPEGLTGLVRWVLIVPDPFGGFSVGQAVMHITSAETRDLRVRYHGLQLIFDKAVYEIGDTARVLVLVDEPISAAWFWIDSGHGVIDKRLLKLRQGANLFEIRITDVYIPNVRASIVAVRQKQLLRDDVDVRVAPTRQILDVQLRLDKSSYRPREKAKVELVVRSAEGQPVKGEFSLSVYDKAIEYFQSQLREDIRRYFYGRTRDIWSEFAFSVITPERFRTTIPAPSFSDYRLLQELEEARTSSLQKLALRERRAGPPTAEVLAVRADFAGAAAKSASAPVGRAAALEMDRTQATMAPALLRTDFRDSVFWSPRVETDETGRAEIEVTLPDSLATWRLEAIGIDSEERVGEQTTVTMVRKNLLVRLATPRFLVERDRAVASTIVRNDLETTKDVTLELMVEGATVDAGKAPPRKTMAFRVGPREERRFDWPLLAERPGVARLRATALTDEESDAVETSVPVVSHGIDKKVFRVGSSDSASSGTRQVLHEEGLTVVSETIDIPHEITTATARLVLHLSPSLAVCIREALPYLVNYPYGCVEQTMSRFLPAVIVAHAFQDLEIPRDEALLRELPEVVRAGVERLRDFQNPDGSWGWWKGSPTDDTMTAHVMYGLTLAREVDVAVPEEMFSKGLAYLRRHVNEATSLDMSSLDYRARAGLHALAYQAYVLARNGERPSAALELLWQKREELSPMGLALLARAHHRTGDEARSKVLLRNLMNFAVPVAENDTIHWERRQPDAWSWWWWNDKVEATCHALEALIDVEPTSPDIDRAVRWLVLNRRGAQWKSTKDTGLAVLALTHYLSTRPQEPAPTVVRVFLGEEPPREYRFTKDNFFTFSPSIVLEGNRVPSGRVELRLQIEGSAPVYYSWVAEFTTREEAVSGAGHELFVERSYERWRGRKLTGEGTWRDEWEPLKDGAALEAGDRIRVSLDVRALNDYEYVVIEDPRPAGCEALITQSGWRSLGTLSGYAEFRDRWTACFFDHIPQGRHTLYYELRAETPGHFHTMPARGYAMYFPDLHGNSAEWRVEIRDRRD